jgi:hypothetical protein
MNPIRLPTALLALAIILSLSAQSRMAVAQDRVIIQPRTVVLAPARKETARHPARAKATARYPIILGLTNASVLARIQHMLAVKSIFGSTLEEYRRDEGFEDFDYKLNYNKNYLLDITFSHSGMGGAYPSTERKHFLINLKNGMIVKATDAFKAEALATLARMANQKLKAETKDLVKVVAEDKEQDAEQKASLKEQLEQLTFTIESLNQFSVSDKGVTFLYDAGFPHVIQALQPDGEYFFTHAELRSYIKPTGPLGIFR